MLKNRETYEIMTPQSIGRTSSDLVIGKHSGRNAVRSKLEALGYASLDDAQVATVFAAVKELADKKKVVHDEDIEALVLGSVYRLPDRYRLVSLSVQSSTPSMPATAAVAIQDGDTLRRQAGFGVGPIDATFNVIASMLGRSPHLERYAVNAITGGTDAQGEVTVRLSEGALSSTGRGSDPDVITASAIAYVDALNRLAAKEKENDRC
jgi:2-isopropylmalate synthase